MSDKQTEKTIQLDTPIKRGKTEITEIVLRKPQSGALRGTRLQAIMDMDVNAMMTVIPRISSPALTAQEIAEMDPADLTAMSVEVVTFLLKKSVLAGLPYQAELQVPQDIAVIGYDDIELASFMTPPLTTIHQPKDELGELAIDVLIHRITQPTLQQQRLQLTPILMERGSA
ncbi:tail E family protein [Escherichia coli]|nr:tail E family protein [Escherichia coli]